MIRLRSRIIWGLFLLATAASVSGDEPAAPTSSNPSARHEFTRMVAHWTDYADPGYLPFIDDAKPEIVQVGFYGAHFWSLAHTPHGKGYPAHFPVQGLAECGKFFSDLNRELHRRNVKVVGHMNVKFLVGEIDGPDGPQGFFKFYRDLWDEKLLGPKPVADPRTFLEVDRQGNPIVQQSYSIGKMHEYWACLNNPHWRAVLKAWVRRGIEQGVDGFVANYFYRHDCHCEHCVVGFKQHLRDRYTAEQLREQFMIVDLDGHRFDEIVAWHKPEESTPLRREMLRYSQLANKQAFDEVFLKYGRSLKPDLLVAQWNHLGYFNQIGGDERCMLPADVWGRGEDYLWYSTGASGCYTDLEGHYLGEGTLQARYIRGTFDDKPFTLGKYEHTRLRVTIAELAANGGAPMGFYTRFKDADARATIVRYYNFLREHDEVYRGNRSHAEVLLLYPRSHVQNGDIDAVAKFKQTGERLLDEHVLFDVRPDDLPEARHRYSAVIDPLVADLAKLSEVLPMRRTTLAAPWTVRLSASRPTDDRELTLHLVNYNRIEPEKKKSAGGGGVDEKPIAAPASVLRVVPPEGKTFDAATAHSPEWDSPRPLKTSENDGRLEIEVPEFLVYCVVRIAMH